MPISRFDYVTGRFAGTMVVCSLTYVIGAGALAASSLMPWLDPARIGPFRLAPYAFAIGVLILPTLVALGAAIYALASWTRSTLATYLGVVGFFAANAIAGLAASNLESARIGQLLDPFGVWALRGAVEYWTIAELNTAIPEVGGTLLWNRILWLGLGLAALGLTVVALDPSRARRPDRTRIASETATPGDAASRVRLPAVSRVFSRRSVAIQFQRQVWHEAASVLRNLPFLGILAFGLFVVVQAALGLYTRGVALAAVYPVLISVLACFFHVVARSKFVGYGLMMVFIVSWDLIEELGFEHHLYRFAIGDLYARRIARETTYTR